MSCRARAKRDSSLSSATMVTALVCSAAQALQCFSHRPHLHRQRLIRRIDRALQPCDALRRVFHFVQIVEQRHLLSGLLKVLLLHPDQVFEAPCPMPAGLVCPGAAETCSAGSGHATDRVRPPPAHAPGRATLHVPHSVPTPGELPGTVAARQLLGVAPICLDPIPGPDRYRRGRHHLAVDAQWLSCQTST